MKKTFKLLNNLDKNAIAIYHGDIYFHTGLWRICARVNDFLLIQHETRILL
jgi:hypothetical protein